MKKMIVFVLTGVLIHATAVARDFIVEFVEENYQEAQTAYSNDPLVYHSIQVTSQAGPKLLILTGNDREYRQWIRHYIAGHKQFIAKVPDKDNDRFISSKAFELSVTRLHPFNLKKWSGDPALSGSFSSILSEGQILVIDANATRSQLVSTVIKRMGYTAMISHDNAQALAAFKNQPEKFKMIIAHYNVPGMTTESMVDHLLKIDHTIPILVETGYQNSKMRDHFISRFSSAGTVAVTPVVLKDLQNTIKRLVKGKKV